MSRETYDLAMEMGFPAGRIRIEVQIGDVTFYAYKDEWDLQCAFLNKLARRTSDQLLFGPNLNVHGQAT